MLILLSSGCEKPVEEEPLIEIVEEQVEEVEEKPVCPESCDDENVCTKDSCSEETEYECIYDNVPLCCGNDICEITEDAEECPDDCPICETNDECKEAYFDYNERDCKEKNIIPCCGNSVCDLFETYDTCSEDCEEEDEDLGDFPDFLDDGVLMVIGNKAPATDVISATNLATYLRTKGIEPEIALSDEIDELDNDVILIGRPCDNPFVNEVLDIGEHECGGFLPVNTAVIKLIEEDNIIIVITGHGPDDIKEAVEFLIDEKAEGVEEVLST